MDAIYMPERIQKAAEALEGAGYRTYLIGESVWKTLRGLKPRRYTLFTSANEEQVFGVLSEKPAFITPDSDQRQELSGHAYTIGAIAYSPRRGFWDPYRGREDLHILRLTGKSLGPEAVLEGLKLISEGGFCPEPETAAFLTDNAALLQKLPAETLTDGIIFSLQGAYAGLALRLFPALWCAALPELQAMVGLDQRNRHHLYDVWVHTSYVAGNVPPDLTLRFAALLHDIGKPSCMTQDTYGERHFKGHPAAGVEIAKRVLDRLALPSGCRTEILSLVRWHDEPLGGTVEAVRESLSRHGEALCRKLLALKRADAIGQGTAPGNLKDLQETERFLNAALQQSQQAGIK